MAMKKIWFVVIVLLGMSLVLYGVLQAAGSGEKPKPKKETKAEVLQPQRCVVKASGRSLWDYLQKVNYRKEFHMWPGTAAFRKGTEPHGPLVTTWLNGDAWFIVDSKKFDRFADDSLIVQEDYSPDKKLKSISIMYKETGFNPGGADWFWAKYGPDGKIEVEGCAAKCIDCHAKKKSNDYVVTGSIKK